MANVVPETLPSYTFTGQQLLLDDGDGHWRIKFLSSGVLEWLSPDTVIDLFLVGAGGAGGHIRGGGGGYTQTYKQITIKRGQRIQITVGAGGNGMFVGGGSTTFDS